MRRDKPPVRIQLAKERAESWDAKVEWLFWALCLRMAQIARAAGRWVWARAWAIVWVIILSVLGANLLEGLRRFQ